jgi:PD-(D/E)XK endonuclease
MRTTQRKGDIAVARAAYTFMLLGHDVSRPLTESARYDLIVDTGTSLFRVQVRYCGPGRDVPLRRIHSNSQGYVVKKTEAGAYDWLYVLTGDGREYLVKECLHGRNAVRLNEKWRIQIPEQPRETPEVFFSKVFV